MGAIYFKKTVDDVIRITDTVFPVSIGNSYFKLQESNFPFDSLLFKEHLEVGTIFVVKMDTDIQKDYYFKKYIKPDEKIEEVKRVEKEVHAEYQKEQEKKFKKEEQKKQKAVEKQVKKKEAEEKKRMENVTIISDDEIEESVAKHLLA